jgi:hypothetical protein
MTAIVLVLLLLMIGALPAWPHSQEWGYDLSGGLGMLLVVLVTLALTHIAAP